MKRNVALESFLNCSVRYLYLFGWLCAARLIFKKPMGRWMCWQYFGMFFCLEWGRLWCGDFVGVDNGSIPSAFPSLIVGVIEWRSRKPRCYWISTKSTQQYFESFVLSIESRNISRWNDEPIYYICYLTVQRTSRFAVGMGLWRGSPGNISLHLDLGNVPLIYEINLPWNIWLNYFGDHWIYQ